jgi:hypothetical protein
MNTYLNSPIGVYVAPSEIHDAAVQKWISQISRYPEMIKAKVSALSEVEKERIQFNSGVSVEQFMHYFSDQASLAMVCYKQALNGEVAPYIPNNIKRLVRETNVPLKASFNVIGSTVSKLTWMMKNTSSSQRNTLFTYKNGHRHTVAWYIGFLAWQGRLHIKLLDKYLTAAEEPISSGSKIAS